MKTTTVVFALAAAGSVAAAGGHRHQQRQHQHHHNKRATEVVNVPGPTVFAYELDGEVIPQEKACGGIDGGDLVWADGEHHPDACKPPPSSSPSPTPSTSKDDGGAAFYEMGMDSSTAAPSSSASPPPPPPPPKPSSSSSSVAPPPSPSPSSPSKGPGGDSGHGLDREFPDGKLSCSEFPSDYGALHLDYLRFGGWSGIQHVGNLVNNAFGSIRTATEDSGCEDGAMCSYACPPGYQKSQWPESQGSTGQSIGGLKCENGKLHLTNSKLSKKLCVEGSGGIKVKNNLSKQVSVCRTDYPGTESQTVPLSTKPGDTHPLTCPKESEYFRYEGKPTSAQYYVNPMGVGVEDACRWGDSSSHKGNWAPVNIGAGTTAGTAWLSIFQNSPTTDAKLDFKVRIEGPDLSGSCRYENGMYHGDAGSNKQGCTASSPSGKATFIFEH